VDDLRDVDQEDVKALALKKVEFKCFLRARQELFGGSGGGGGGGREGQTGEGEWGAGGGDPSSPSTRPWAASRLDDARWAALAPAAPTKQLTSLEKYTLAAKVRPEAHAYPVACSCLVSVHTHPTS
jgi:hypothetical protein